MGGGPASDADTSVTCRVATEFPAYDHREKHEVNLVVSLEAPETLDESRVPLAASCVIDKSGSMGGEKIKLVKQTMKWICKQLKASENGADALGVVSFDSSVEDTFDMQMLAGSHTKDAVYRAVDKVQAGTCTNLSGGLFRGIQQLQGRKSTRPARAPDPPMPPLPLAPVANILPEAEEEEEEQVQQMQAPVMQQALGPVPNVAQQNAATSDSDDDNDVEWWSEPPVQQQAVQQRQAGGTLNRIRNFLGGGGGGRTRGRGRVRHRPHSSQARGVEEAVGEMDWESDAPVESDPLAGREMVKSVLLFTDGLANEGVTNSKKLEGAVRRMLERSPGIRVSTFGFGVDHDPAFLQGLANVGGGEYYYVENADEIPATFANALGGLMSVTSQNVCVTIMPGGPGVTLRRPHTRFPVEAAGDGWKVAAGDLFSEERRDLLVVADVVPTATPADGAPLVVVELSYMDVLAGEVRDGVASTSIARPAAGGPRPAETSPPDLLVVKQRCRVAAAEAMEAAQTLPFDEKRAALERAGAEIRGSPAAADPLCVALLDDLTELLQDMRTKEQFERVGSKKTVALSAGWQKQRSRAKKGKADFYSNRAQSVQMEEAAKSDMFGINNIEP